MVFEPLTLVLFQIQPSDQQHSVVLSGCTRPSVEVRLVQDQLCIVVRLEPRIS